MALLPMETSIRAELLKLNIYPEGGHFVAHRDTPMSAESVASLVVVLPTAHIGGDLSVQHRNFKQTYKFAEDFALTRDYSLSHSVRDQPVEKANGYYEIDLSTFHRSFGDTADTAARRDAARLRRVECGMPKRLYAYTAFYCDAVHDIKPVQAGVRMTLTYQLYRDSSPSSLASSPSSNGSNSLVSETNSSTTASASANSNASSSASSLPSFSSSKRPAAEMAEDTSAASATATSSAPAPAAPKEDYQRFSVKELKDKCRDRALPVGGTKPKLVERLQAFDAGGSSSKKGRRDVWVPSGPVEYLNTKLASAKSRAFLHKLRLALMNPNFFPEGGRLAFPCFHLYEREEELPQSDPLEQDIKCQDLKLRGADALIAVCAARVGLDVSFLRLMMIEDGGDGTGWQEVDDLVTCQYAKSHFGKNIDSSEYGECDEGLDDVEWAIEMPSQERHCDAVPIARVMEAMVSATGYFGNEACDGCIYAQCAIVLTIPEECDEERNKVIERATQMSTALPEQIFESTRRGLPVAEELQAAQARFRAFGGKKGGNGRSRFGWGWE